MTARPLRPGALPAEVAGEVEIVRERLRDEQKARKRTRKPSARPFGRACPGCGLSLGSFPNRTAFDGHVGLCVPAA